MNQADLNTAFSSRIENTWHRMTALNAAYGAALLIGFGVLLRLAKYLANDSLYVDEGALTLNIINRSFVGLLRPLDYEQGAPVGFLMIERLVVWLFGASEYALRFFPFVASIASLFLFYRVAEKCLGVAGSFIALLFFNVCEPLIEYGAQVKQYASDVTFTLLIFLVAMQIQEKELTRRNTLLFSVFGAVMLWFSHPAAFVLAGVGTMMFLRDLFKKRYARLKSLVIIGITWAISFGLFYTLSLRNLAASEYLGAFWNKRRSFMPLPPTSLADLQWFSDALFRLFYNPVGSPDPTLAGIIFLLGCLAFILKKKRMILALLGSPLLFALFASGLHLYPFAKRLMLWAVPTLLILLAAGLYYTATIKPPYTLPVSLILTGLLLFAPMRFAIQHVRHPSDDSGLRDAVAYIKKNKTEGDAIYSYHKQKEAFEYYALRYSLNPEDFVAGEYPEGDSDESLLDTYKKVAEKFQSRARLWAVFTYVRSRESFKEEDLFVEYINQKRTRQDYTEFKKTSVYRYTSPAP